jgi:hypothetical protein
MPVQADDQGMYSWTNVEGDEVSLTVTAQGYFEAKQSATIERGLNEVVVTLSRDPMGILPEEACAPGQPVLYIEDFQDGLSRGWETIPLGIGGDMPNGWSIIDEDGNKILVHADAPSGGGDTLQERTFGNFVWHIKYKSVGQDADMFFMWRLSRSDAGQKRYVVVVGGGYAPGWYVSSTMPADPTQWTLLKPRRLSRPGRGTTLMLPTLTAFTRYGWTETKSWNIRIPSPILKGQSVSKRTLTRTRPPSFSLTT